MQLHHALVLIYVPYAVLQRGLPPLKQTHIIVMDALAMNQNLSEK